jgi:hypothetical protein
VLLPFLFHPPLHSHLASFFFPLMISPLLLISRSLVIHPSYDIVCFFFSLALLFPFYRRRRRLSLTFFFFFFSNHSKNTCMETLVLLLSSIPLIWLSFFLCSFLITYSDLFHHVYLTHIGHVTSMCILFPPPLHAYVQLYICHCNHDQNR